MLSEAAVSVRVCQRISGPQRGAVRVAVRVIFGARLQMSRLMQKDISSSLDVATRARGWKLEPAVAEVDASIVAAVGMSQSAASASSVI